MKELADALPTADDPIILSMSLVHEILEYIHMDFHCILHKKAPNGYKIAKEKFPIDIIL